MVGMQTRDWVSAGLRGVLGGLAAIALAMVSFPLVPLFLVALALSWFPGVLPAVTALVRFRVGLQRRLGAHFGVPIARPYAPRPQRPGIGGYRLVRWILRDPATWRDFAWLIPGGVLGLVLGIVSLAVPLYGVEGVLLIPLWIWLGTGWYGYGAIWPIRSLSDGFLSMPQGLVILFVGLLIAPRLRWTAGRFDRLLLAPTRAAELRLRVAQLTVTRSDTIDAQAAELRRIERDLHDGAQARLVSLGMAIGLAEELVDRDPATARKLLAEARAASSTALVELRDLVRGIHPPVLAERGLAGAIRALAFSLPMPITVDADLPGRPDTPVESAVYFAAAEALANVVRHSRARSAWISLAHAGPSLFLMIGDDGAGGADPAAGTGLRGIERRLAAFDGTMTLSSPPGGPTVVTMEMPCALSSPKITPSSAMA